MIYTGGWRDGSALDKARAHAALAGDMSSLPSTHIRQFTSTLHLTFSTGLGRHCTHVRMDTRT